MPSTSISRRYNLLTGALPCPKGWLSLILDDGSILPGTSVSRMMMVNMTGATLARRESELERHAAQAERRREQRYKRMKANVKRCP